jgi:hypothetical protein
MSPRYILKISLFLLALFFLYFPQVGAAEENDWEFWNNYFFDWGLTDNWKAKVAVEFKFDDDMSNHYYNHVDAGVSGKLSEWFRFGVNYRHIEEDTGRSWNTEYRPSATGTFVWNWGNFSLSDRNRMEYRDREASSNTWRYRNRLMVRPPQKWTKFQIQPYFSGELLYQFDVSSWDQYRLAAGLSSRISQLFKMDIYYMLKSSESYDDWTNTNIFGLKLGLVF